MWWKGNWNSTHYENDVANGKLFIYIPDKALKDGDRIQTSVHVQYQGSFNRGKVVDIPVKVWLEDMRRDTDQIIVHNVSVESPIFHISSSSNGINQNISYVAKMITDDTVSGKYVSSCPIDKGTFLLTNTNEEEYTLPTSTSCTIL